MRPNVKAMFVLVFCTGLLGIFCTLFLVVSNRETVPPVATVATAAEAPQIITVGNRSYVPTNMSGTPASNARAILDGIAIFEQTRNLKVLDFKFETNLHETHIYGLWLAHEPR